MKKMTAILLAVSVSMAALAQERTFLPKADVENLASGKKWTYVRASDSNKVNWDLRSGGNLFANNLTRNRTDAGTWLVNDQGHLCVKWRGSSTDGCVAVFKEGDKFKRVISTDLNGVPDELTVE